MSAFPPFRTQAGLPVPPETALLFLSTYLESAKTSPHFLPNARLEASGPTAGSSNSSVTIHNLQRVEAGLKGEWLAPQLELEEEAQEAKEEQKEAEKAEGWMDLDQYQREQSVEGPGQNQEDLGVEDDGDVEETAAVEYSENANGDVMMAETNTSVKSAKKASKKLDPQARKKEKKERLKAEKRAKEEERKKAQAA